MAGRKVAPRAEARGAQPPAWLCKAGGRAARSCGGASCSPGPAARSKLWHLRIRMCCVRADATMSGLRDFLAKP